MSTLTEQCGSLESGQSIADLCCDRPVVNTRNRWYLPVKLTVEWILALILVVVSSPLALVIAILVKLSSPGPIIYSQTRLGRNSKVFRIFKFRTMVQGAENGTGPIWASANDCRITGFGRLLRASHFDELPQLWNVLRGEMSLIGPRPERPELAARISRRVPEFRHRLGVRPGITGLAQLLLPADDPNDTEMRCVRRKLTHDIQYIRDLGMMMDFRIALGTPCYLLSTGLRAVEQKLIRVYEIHDSNDSAQTSDANRHEYAAAISAKSCD